MKKKIFAWITVTVFCVVIFQVDTVPAAASVREQLAAISVPLDEQAIGTVVVNEVVQVPDMFRRFSDAERALIAAARGVALSYSVDQETTDALPHALYLLEERARGKFLPSAATYAAAFFSSVSVGPNDIAARLHKKGVAKKSAEIIVGHIRCARDLNMTIAAIEDFDAVTVTLINHAFMDEENIEKNIKEKDRYQFQDYMDLIVQKAESVDDIFLLFAREYAVLNEYRANGVGKTAADNRSYYHHLYCGAFIYPSLAERLNLEETSQQFSEIVSYLWYMTHREDQKEFDEIKIFFEKMFQQYHNTALYEQGALRFPVDQKVVRAVILQPLEQSITDRLAEYGITDVRVQVRLKSIWSIVAKLKKKEYTMETMRDLIAVRLVADDDVLYEALPVVIDQLGYFDDLRSYVEREKFVDFTNINVDSPHYGDPVFTAEEFSTAYSIQRLCRVLFERISEESGGVRPQVHMTVDGLNTIITHFRLDDIFEREIEETVMADEPSEIQELYLKTKRTTQEQQWLNRLIIEQLFSEQCPRSPYRFMYEVQSMTPENYKRYMRASPGAHMAYKFRSLYSQKIQTDKVIFSDSVVEDLALLKESVQDHIIALSAERGGPRLIRLRRERTLPVDYAGHQFVTKEIKKDVIYYGVDRWDGQTKQWRKCQYNERLRSGDIVRLREKRKTPINRKIITELLREPHAVRTSLFLTALLEPDFSVRRYAQLGVKQLIRNGFELKPDGQSGEDKYFIEFVRQKLNVKNTQELYATIGANVRGTMQARLIDELVIQREGWKKIVRIFEKERSMRSQQITSRKTEGKTQGKGKRKAKKNELPMLPTVLKRPPESMDRMFDRIEMVLPDLVHEGKLQKPHFRHLLFALGKGTIDVQTVWDLAKPGVISSRVKDMEAAARVQQAA